MASPKTPKPSAAGEFAVVTIKSTPEGADITIDRKFFGDTPTTARLAAGDYAISIEKAGYKPWKRTVSLTEGGTVTLDATLEEGTQCGNHWRLPLAYRRDHQEAVNDEICLGRCIFVTVDLLRRGGRSEIFWQAFSEKSRGGRISDKFPSERTEGL